jgi:hypothetical protein
MSQLKVNRIPYYCLAGIVKEIKLKELFHGFNIHIRCDENSLHGLKIIILNLQYTV